MAAIDKSDERERIQFVSALRRITRDRLIGNLPVDDYKVCLADLLATYPHYCPYPPMGWKTDRAVGDNERN